MTRNELKIELQKQARLAKGLVNLLKDDTDCINIDADNFDLFDISDAILEARLTIQKLNDCLTGLETVVSMSIQDISRK